MVVFTCSNCGDSVKKPQVEKHFMQRRCWGSVLCCIDCCKDFPGDTYKSHNSCITENERYGGKNYVAKPNVNKGEQKQQIWFEKVISAIEKSRSKNPPWLQKYFERLKDFPNIPCKKAKFEAFVKNSMYIRDTQTISKMWETIDQNVEKQVPPTNQNKGKNDDSNSQKQTENINGNKDIIVDTTVTAEQESEKKLSKRERKENRRKEAHKKEKKDSNSENVNGDITENVEKKKKKKRKYSDTTDETHSGKKRKADELNDTVKDENGEPVNEEEGDQSDEEEPAKKKHKTKFDWSGVIIKVLQGKDSEIKMKKLRKKVLGEYLSQGCTETSEEKLWAKFDKKLKKNPLFKIQNDRVKLKN